MRRISRPTVMGIMVAVPLAMAGDGQAAAHADICVSVRSDLKIGTERGCPLDADSDEPLFLVIAPDTTAAVHGYLKLGDVKGESK